MLRSYLKRILSSPLFWACSIILTIAMLIGVFEDLRVADSNSISLLYCWIVTNSIGISHVLLPVLSTIPFTFFYVDRLEKKAVYYTMIRSNTRNYYLSDVGASMISSALVTLVSSTLFLGFCAALGAGNNTQDSVTQYFLGTWFENWSAGSAYGKILLIHVLDYLLFSLPWALLGVLVSLFCRNKYVIIAAPFIGFMLISYITEMVSADYLSPGNMLLKGAIRNTPGGGILYAAIYFVGLSAVFGAAYYMISRRRIKHEGI